MNEFKGTRMPDYTVLSKDRDIYGEVTLASYTQNDPVEIHRVQLYNAQEKTKRLQLELEALQNENY